MQPIKAAELFIEKIKKDYPNDVSLVVIMGSTIYKENHSRSDIDMFYVPKTDKGHNLSFTCIIDGIGYDFWAISWERLTRIANHEERITSIVSEGQILYCAADEDMERFNTLKANALDVSDKKRLISMAEDVMDKACIDIVALESDSNIRDVRYHSICAIYSMMQALSLINGITIKRGRGKLKGEILAMPIKPLKFETLYDTVFFSDNMYVIKASMLELCVDIRELINAENIKLTPTESFEDNWSQLYEELINAYNKIAHACEIGDPITSLFAAAELVNEIESASVFCNVDVKMLPDIIAAYNPKDLSLFEKVAKEHQSALENLLCKNGVSIRRFADFKELEEYLEDL